MADDERPVIYELFLSDTSPAEEQTVGDKKIIWKDILREGEFPLTPGLTGVKRAPFKVITDGQSDPANRVISMSDLEAAFEDKAFEHVTIPTKHTTDEDPLDNHGYVTALRRVKKKGMTVLQGGLGFTEPDTAKKVRNGSVPNVSSGIFFNFLNKARDKKYPVALKHVCFSKVPFINNLDPFPAVFASDAEVEGEPIIETYMFADPAATDTADNPNTGEIVWKEQGSFNWIRSELEAALNPRDNMDDSVPSQPRASYYVQDVSPDNRALCEEYYKGNRTRFVIPFTISNDELSIAPQLRWTEVKEAMIAASDDDDSESVSIRDTNTFEELSSKMLRERLTTRLGEELGDHAKGFEIEDVSFDHRAKIRSTTDGAIFIAKFATVGGTVLLSPSSEWEAVEDGVEEPPKADVPQSTPAAPAAVTASDNSVYGRLTTARERRRRLSQSK